MKALASLALLVLAFPAHAKLKVVATTADLGAIAREVGGDAVDVEVLSQPTQDPHYVDAKPSLVLTLSRADLLLLNGLELEVGWLPTLLTSSRNPKVQKGQPGYLDGSTLAVLKEVPTGKLDRAMGDVHPGGNPHYARDPRNGVRLAMGIGARLAQLEPASAAAFEARAKAFAAELEQKMARWLEKLEPLQGANVVTYHKSWSYFTEWAGWNEVAYLEPKPGLPPSTGHVAKVLEVIRSRKVTLLLQEEWYSAATSELLAKKGGARLVRVPGMPKLNQRYTDYLDRLVAAIVP